MGSPHSPNATRRFRPEPLEVSSRSSKRNEIETSDTPQTAPKDSDQRHGDKARSQEHSDSPRHEPVNIEPTSTETLPKKRRFLPQPTEVSARHSGQRTSVFNAERDRPKKIEASQCSRAEDKSPEGSKPTSRRPLPLPIETSSSTSKDSPTKHGQFSPTSSSQRAMEDRSGQSKPARRFHPEPVESMKLRRRQKLGDEPEQGGDSTDAGTSSPNSTRTAPRKFAPQLIETAKRSFRKGEAKEMPAIHNEGIIATNENTRVSYDRVLREADHALIDAEEPRLRPPESRFSYASLVQRQEGRRHSFRVPDLPAIPSNSSEGSDGSDVPSLSTSPSTSSEESAKRLKLRDQFRESCDERFSGYLLELAARSAEKQLREQALAAFPNEQIHEPVSHFAIDGDEDSDGDDTKAGILPRYLKTDISPFRRESAADMSWELEEMRRHKEKAELRDHQSRNGGAHQSKFSAAAIAARQTKRIENNPIFGGWQRDVDVELTQMRNAASPPMLGGDLLFPFSVSPQATGCENDQGTTTQPDSQKAADKKYTKLWCADPLKEEEDGSGLWMGLCRKDEEELQSPQVQTFRPGIMTPAPDVEGDPYISLNKIANHRPNAQLLLLPSESKSPLEHMDRMLRAESQIDREFHDGFVTQVYNYLSLGYPSLARYYDHELSKISGIPVNDLRRDDLNTDAKGYVGVPEGAGVRADLITAGKCMRWTALRLYIREWGRQQPRMAGGDISLDAWGVRERRGSWAV